MSKTSNCLRIIEILKTKKNVSSTEIAYIMNINKRNIIEYIKELEECGFKINSTIGKNGGYILESYPDYSNVELDEKMLDINNYIKSYTKLSIIYKDYNNKTNSIIFHPYRFFNSDKISIVGFNEDLNEMEFILLDSIISYNPINEHFTKNNK